MLYAPPVLFFTNSTPNVTPYNVYVTGSNNIKQNYRRGERIQLICFLFRWVLNCVDYTVFSIQLIEKELGFIKTK